MANKYSRLKPKIQPIPFVVLGAIVILIAVLVVVLKPDSKKGFYESYKQSDIPEDHVFEEISLKQLNKKIAKNEKLLVYFGYPGCTNCISEVKYYQIEFYNQGMDEKFSKIYYINLAKLKEKEFETLVELFNIQATESGFKAELFYFNEGELVISRGTYTSGNFASQIVSFYKAVKNKA